MMSGENFGTITVKVEHPEYGPMQHTTTAEQLSSVRLFEEAEPMATYMPFRNEMYEKLMGDDTVIDFIENSIDKFLVSYQKKDPNTDKLTKGAERQRRYRQKESFTQRERRLETARTYVRKRRLNENEQERFERLRKQRDRIRQVREMRRMNPELDKVKRQAEAERMKIRRARENSEQRMRRLEQSRQYSRRRRESETFRVEENEKNKISHQFKRSDVTFRLLERQRDRMRKQIKRHQIGDEVPPSSDSLHLDDSRFNST